MKTCTRCGVSQPEADFSPRAASADGLSSACKICRARDKKAARAVLKARPEHEIEAASAARPPRACRTCKEVKGPEGFPRDRGRRDGRGTLCLVCQAQATRYYQSIADPAEVKRRKRADFQNNRETYRRAQLRMNFGITLERYREVHDEQDGVCAICGEPETATVRGRVLVLAVDHDHVTGKVRQLLCGACNKAVGFFRDSPDLMRRAAAYIENHRDQQIREAVAPPV